MSASRTVEYDQLIAYARSRHVDYIIVAEWHLRQGGFPVLTMLDERHAPPGLSTYRVFFADRPEDKYVVYRLLPQS